MSCNLVYHGEIMKLLIVASNVNYKSMIKCAWLILRWIGKSKGYENELTV